MQYDCMSLMGEDILAARTTGQPTALASAIRKIHSLLADHPTQLEVYRLNSAVPLLHGYWVIQSDVFVSPPLANGRGNIQRQAVYDLLVDFRVENLQTLEAGTRKPHETIRAAKTVIKPEGWR